MGGNWHVPKEKEKKNAEIVEEPIVSNGIPDGTDENDDAERESNFRVNRTKRKRKAEEGIEEPTLPTPEGGKEAD